jgi:hypothetical protein
MGTGLSSRRYTIGTITERPLRLPPIQPYNIGETVYHTGAQVAPELSCPLIVTLLQDFDGGLYDQGS